MTVLATSCGENGIEDWDNPQSHSQEEAVTIPNFQASAVDPIDLNNGEESVQAFTTSVSALPDGYSVSKYTVEITPTGIENATTTTLQTTDYTLKSSDLQELVETFYGKRPTARTFTSHIYATVDNGEGGALVDCGNINVVVTPAAPYISEHYYLIGAPAGNEANKQNGWSTTEVSMPFSHSAQNVYDDPVFTITFPVTDGDTWFAVIDDKTLASGERSDVLGCAEGNGKNGATGKIARRSEIGDDGSFKVSVDGDAQFIRVTLNMMEYTYTIEKLNFAEYIYEIGANTSWGSCIPLASPSFDGKYTGYAWLNGEFKFKPNEDNWNGDWEMVKGGTAYEGTLSETGDSNVSAPDAGFYKIDVDLTAMTYKLTAISGISIVGDATGDSSWGTDLDLTYDTSASCWTGTFSLVAGQYKFRADHAWTISWGGTEDDLTTANGANLKIAAAGKYNVKLYVPCEGKSYCEVSLAQ